MSIEDILPNVFSILPGLQTVTHYVMADGGTWGAGASVTDVEKRPLDATDKEAAGIRLDSEACAFAIWEANVSSTPKQGDKITDASSVTWHVRSVSSDLLENRHVCACVKSHD